MVNILLLSLDDSRETVSASDELTPETPPPVMLDRAIRADANTLFCGRSGLAFEYQLEGNIINNFIQTLDSIEPQSTISATPRRVVGVGNVGRLPDRATYTLYDPDTDIVKFRNLSYKTRKGFGA